MNITQKAGYKEPTARLTSTGKEIKHTLVVSTDDTSNGIENRIAEHSSTPQYGDSYPYDDDLKVSDVQIVTALAGNFIQWEVEVTYKVPEDDTVVTTKWSEDLSYETRGQSVEIPFEVAYDSLNNQNVAVQSTTFEPLIGATTTVTNTIVDITYNTDSFRNSWIKEYSNTVNSSNTKIVGISVNAKQAKILNIGRSSTKTDDEGNEYFTVSISVEISNSDFVRRLANVGFKRSKTTIAPSTALDTTYIFKSEVSTLEDEEEDEKINEPTKLDANSQIITGTGILNLEFNEFKASNWQSINIPKEAD